jgi:hypothetical protein
MRSNSNLQGAIEVENFGVGTIFTFNTALQQKESSKWKSQPLPPSS